MKLLCDGKLPHAQIMWDPRGRVFPLKYLNKLVICITQCMNNINCQGNALLLAQQVTCYK